MAFDPEDPTINMLDGIIVPQDPMDLLQCDSCQ